MTCSVIKSQNNHYHDYIYIYIYIWGCFEVRIVSNSWLLFFGCNRTLWTCWSIKPGHIHAAPFGKCRVVSGKPEQIGWWTGLLWIRVISPILLLRGWLWNYKAGPIKHRCCHIDIPADSTWDFFPSKLGMQCRKLVALEVHWWILAIE